MGYVEIVENIMKIIGALDNKKIIPTNYLNKRETSKKSEKDNDFSSLFTKMHKLFINKEFDKRQESS